VNCHLFTDKTTLAQGELEDRRMASPLGEIGMRFFGGTHNGAALVRGAGGAVPKCRCT
jgi:hypothetical protein